ncbi:putative inactive purple acid phosphatase 1 [Zea mays]|uniref:Putative inactive purple acid phosphatase 1 n=1 Tax=Zea mays TaxID=4577 RepID=A0A1D6H1L2_MAIZE|nr:putative inactive purple acid phosphatase 1 [Zea mays]
MLASLALQRRSMPHSRSSTSFNRPLDRSDEDALVPDHQIAAMEPDLVAAGASSSPASLTDRSDGAGSGRRWGILLAAAFTSADHVPVVANARDYAETGSVYVTPDSGGECEVAYESYFCMPAVSKDKPWHRPMYSSHVGIPVNVDLTFVASVEPLLLKHQVDLVFFGHVHNYERTCAVYKNRCKGKPKKDASGIDTYDKCKYTAPVHATVRAGGFSLDKFPRIVLNKWSLSRVSEFGYARVHATRGDMLVQFVSSRTMEVLDQFRIVKPDPARRLRNKPV